MTMKHYLHTADEVFAEVSSSAAGLTTSEAQARLERDGKNKLNEAKKKSTLARFVDQLKDVMILILLAAAAVSFVIAIVEKDPGELFEPILILLIVILNAIMGVFQESKAEKAIEQEKEKAMEDMRQEIAALAILAAEKIIEQEIQRVGQEAIVEEVIKQARSSGWQS